MPLTMRQNIRCDNMEENPFHNQPLIERFPFLGDNYQVLHDASDIDDDIPH